MFTIWLLVRIYYTLSFYFYLEHKQSHKTLFRACTCSCFWLDVDAVVKLLSKSATRCRDAFNRPVNSSISSANGIIFGLWYNSSAFITDTKCKQKILHEVGLNHWLTNITLKFLYIAMSWMSIFNCETNYELEIPHK